MYDEIKDVTSVKQDVASVKVTLDSLNTGMTRELSFLQA